MIDADLTKLGLTTGMAARLLGVNERNLRRWRFADPNEAPAALRDILTILRDCPGALDALRDEYDPTDTDGAGPIGTNETKRRLRWLTARYPEHPIANR